MGSYVFCRCKSLKSITIPAKATKLGTGLLSYCESLEKAVIKAKLKELPKDTFWECFTLESISLPSTIEVIGSAAFGCCESLENFKVPANTKKVSYHAFFDCKNLEVLDLGSNVTELENELFYGQCWNLEKIIMPKSLTTIGEKMLSGLYDDAKKYLVIEAPKGSYAASWAAEQGITTGYAGNLFKPWATCNRAAIVTFLWRYAGKPEAAVMATFKDMPTDNEDFCKAISWAAEKGITTGWDDNTFRPWNTCNRLAVASFLDRYTG